MHNSAILRGIHYNQMVTRSIPQIWRCDSAGFSAASHFWRSLMPTQCVCAWTVRLTESYWNVVVIGWTTFLKY